MALTFDDSGRLYVAEIVPPRRSFDVWEAVTLADGTKVRLHRRRKPTTDRSSGSPTPTATAGSTQAEVVVEGVEQPTALLWIKGALYVAALGRLERWTTATATAGSRRGPS